MESDHSQYGPHEAIDIALLCFGIGGIVFVLRHYVKLRAEINRRIKAEEAANRLARHDPLTGLPNRRDFLLETSQDLAVVRKDRESAFFIVDLDFFKPVNDLYGHNVGDGVLCEVADRLQSALDGHGIVARLGGDEFGIFISELNSYDIAERIARRLVHDIAQPIHVESLSVKIGVSIGITILDRVELSGIDKGAVEAFVQQALRRADMAMYKAKTEGRGRFRFFENEMDEKLRQHVKLESELGQAIHSGQIVPYYQQLVNLTTQELMGFEILSRWHHPEQGVIPPDTFIPIAEDTGLIGEMTISVLKQALKDAERWPKELSLALNMSPHQLANSTLAQEILGVLTESNFPPHRLVVEVTESGMLERMDDVRGVLSSLRNIGVKVALDDFGTGYSGLYHLRDLEVDVIKIDRSFVMRMSDVGNDKKIVEAIIKLSHAMGLTTIAEGVETPDAIERLQAMGCESAQGYFFGKPMPAKATNEVIAKIQEDLQAKTA